LDRVKKVAFKAAREAGEILRKGVGNVKNIDYKSAFNVVTDVDKASESLIVSIIHENFPDDYILAEESGLIESRDAGRRWLIDPLDGTANFAHSYPFFCVSIALEVAGKVHFGTVYNPLSDELFWAEHGKGAYLNDKAIKVSASQSLAVSLLATGFPPDSKNAKHTNIEQFACITDLSYGVRRDGSAALDLSFVACGRLDAFWEMKLAPWDLGAGTLLIEQAGGRVTNLLGGPFDIEAGHVVASNSHLHEELVNALAFQDIEELSAAQLR
jgi:myo-inositol-1(or 4)-monophosphatase